MLQTVFYVLVLSGLSSSLDNGLARTPPMGWLSWERFRCNTDCKNDPENCIGEKLFMAMADKIVSDGFKDAGYEYVNIDDCWLSHERDSQGKLQADPERFPGGMKALADYMHKRGLKLGIYEDFGTKTCGGYPGSEYYLQLDAQTFADWGVDYLKLDGCYSDPHQYDDDYPPFQYWLNRTGRPMIYSSVLTLHQLVTGIKPNYAKVAVECNLARNYNDIQDSWDSLASILQFYGTDEGNFSSYAKPGYFNDPDEPNYPRIAEYCNVWRNYGDIQDSWDSVSSIIDFYGKDATGFQEVAGPGNFNDPDMLIIGNFGLSKDQERVQMGMWAIMAAPLIMSVDLRNVRPDSKALLIHKRLIAINQDPMGIQGKRINKMSNIDVWTRPIMPKGSFAFAMVNFNNDGMPRKMSVKLSDLGMTAAGGYNVTEVFDGTSMGAMKPSSTLTVQINPSGIFMGMAVPL